MLQSLKSAESFVIVVAIIRFVGYGEFCIQYRMITSNVVRCYM